MIPSPHRGRQHSWQFLHYCGQVPERAGNVPSNSAGMSEPGQSLAARVAKSDAVAEHQFAI